MGAGDEIMAAGHAESVYRADPSRLISICDAAGYPRWHPLWQHHPLIATPEMVARGIPVTRIINAAGARPYIRYPFTRETGITFSGWRAQDHRGRVHLTASERAAALAMRTELGPFLVIEPSPKATTNPNKAWIWARWVELVAATPEIAWVQLLHPDSRILPGVTPILTATMRDACALIDVSDGYVGTEGGVHHAAAAFRKPAVVLFGGCISVQATGYDDHVNIVDDGPGTPCGRWLPCRHCEAAMARITVDQVLSQVQTHWRAAA